MTCDSEEYRRCVGEDWNGKGLKVGVDGEQNINLRCGKNTFNTH